MKYNISQVTAFSVQKSICTYNNNYNSLHLIAIVFAYLCLCDYDDAHQRNCWCY